MRLNSIVTTARVAASAAHGAIDQRRKYTDEPYIHHPSRVAGILQTIDAPEDLIAAAWLHDVVEDTEITQRWVSAQFGTEIGNIVFWVTDISKLEDGNRAVRKAMDRDHIAQADALSQTLKVADLIDNTRDIAKHDPDFAKVYIPEKKALLEVLVRADERLLLQAQKQINLWEAMQVADEILAPPC